MIASQAFTGEAKGDEYKLKKYISRGKYGTVFKADRYPRQGTGTMHAGPPAEEVAIKFIPLDSRPEYLKMVKREVAIINQLAHPHIVRVRDVFQVAKTGEAGPPTPSIGLVMDLARCSLQEYLDKFQNLSEDAIRWLFQQLMLAVHHCHAKMVVQRDIKPGNVLVFKASGSSGSNIILKLADFGWAKRFDISDPKTRAGTLTYAAPEVLRAASRASSRYNPGAADVWSCGVVLFRMLHLREYNMVLDRTRNDIGVTDWVDHIPRPASGDPTLQSYGLLEWMLQVDPEKRATMEDVMAHRWFTKGLPPGAANFNASSSSEAPSGINGTWLDSWLDAAILRHTGVQLQP